MQTTHHFNERQAVRGLRSRVLDFILEFGEEIPTAGARFVTLKASTVPPWVDPRLVEQAVGWVLVLSEDGTLLTCYHNRNALRHIAKKPKHYDALSRRTA